MAQLIRDHCKKLAQEHRLSTHHWKVLNALKECRTGSLGHIAMGCENCGDRHEIPMSCGNRHCPRCTAPKREAWRAKQSRDLLPVPYYHVVFTLPHVLNPLIRDNREELYKLFFAKAVDVLQQFAEQRYGGRFGITALLHTWGQAMGDHYHLHMMIPGGALRPGAKGEDALWVPASPNCLVPVKPLAICFRGAFIKGLEHLYDAGKLGFHCEAMKERAEPGAFRHLLRLAVRRKWNIKSVKTRSNAVGVVNYLALYSYRVATDEKRLRQEGSGEECRIVLNYKDNRDSKRKTMKFTPVAFLERFCLHILPPGLVRVRHYGFLANGQRNKQLTQARRSIEAQGLAVMPLAKTKDAIALEADLPCARCQQPAVRWMVIVCRTAEGGLATIFNADWRRRRAFPGTDSS